MAPCRKPVHIYGEWKEIALHGVHQINRIMNAKMTTFNKCNASVGSRIFAELIIEVA